jgi:alpha-L-rhamnosidase
MLIATNLRTEHLTEPLGIDIPTPRLFWNCEGGAAQTAYRITARRDGITIWDTGKTCSAAMTGIRWDGPQLGSGDSVEWSVRLWDEHDQEGPWQATRFELGLLDPSDWRATWITGGYRPRRRRRYPVDHFRTTFTVPGELTAARLYITACGLYRATINGHRVGDFVMAPGFTSYQKRLHYQTYDVGALLATGVNIVQVELADGWFRGAVGAMGVRNVYGAQTRLLAQLELVDAAGGREVVVSDGSWSWSNDGPIRFADMKDGEIVDLTHRPSYRGSAREVSYPVVPTAANNVPVREQERFTPSATRTPSGRQLLDFGQNIAGYVELAVDGRAGDTVVLRFAEHLDGVGELDMAAIQVRAGTAKASPKQEVRLTLADGRNTYKTSFAVFGFRYAVVESDLTLEPQQVTAIAVYSAMRQTARFSCSHPLVNRLVENTLWSMKGNFLDVPTDCPTRERAPWTGDVQIFARTGTFLMDTAAFLRKWLIDLRDRQGADGKVPCHAPDVRNNQYVPGIDSIKRMDGSPGWADAAVLVPLRLYELYRDESFLRDAYASMKAHVEFQISRTGRTGLFGTPFPQPDRRYIPNVGQAFGEWLEPKDVYQQSVVKDFLAPHPEEATAYLAHVCALMTDVAHLLGHDEDVARFEEYRHGAARAYVNQFTPIDTDRQSKLVRPLALGLLDGELSDETFARLVHVIKERDYRIGTGFLSTPLILPLLSRRGRTDVAYRMLENEQAPGWLHEVLAGATTIWEDWEGQASQNHYSPGSVCQWIFETVCGVDVTGDRAFTIAPQPGGSLTHATLSYDSVFGTVSSAWEIDRDRVRYTVVVPANTTAEVCLPRGTRKQVAAGTWTFEEPRPAIGG